MEQLYKGKICCFEGKQQTNNSLRFIIDETSIREIIGIKEDEYLIDIQDNKRYHILRKNRGYVDQSEKNSIQINEYYVTEISLYQERLDVMTAINYLKTIRKLIKQTKEKQKTKMRKQ